MMPHDAASSVALIVIDFTNCDTGRAEGLLKPDVPSYEIPSVSETFVRSCEFRDFRRGEPIRATSIQLGGSLAGKLSSRLSSTLSSDGLASDGSNRSRRLRRAIADPRLCDALERGITSPAGRQHSPAAPGNATAA
jgi:hypothetical protein